MIAAAPGKLVLTGAYAVLEGAPAIVLAVDRFAVADTSRVARDADVSLEVRQALPDGAPTCDVSALHHEGKKLGLGSSAAALVASLGAVMAERGDNLEDSEVRSTIFRLARRAHSTVQGGGSGVDIAASTHGGVLRYSLLTGGVASVMTAGLPAGLHIATFFSGVSARTSDLRAKVDAFFDRDEYGYRVAMNTLGDASEKASASLISGSVAEAVAAVRGFGEALEQLADAADVPIVPLAFRRLATQAAAENAWFLPSGAGGGDVGVYCGNAPPSADFRRAAAELGMLDFSESVGVGAHVPGVHTMALPLVRGRADSSSGSLSASTAETPSRRVTS